MNGVVQQSPVHRVGLCESQPVTAIGLSAILEKARDLEFAGSVHSLEAGLEFVERVRPDVVVVDKGFGIQPAIEWILALRAGGARTLPVVWGPTISEVEALRFVQAGAKGVVRKTADPATLLICLHAVASGTTWMEETVFREPARDRTPRSELTPREQQVLELIEQGLRNKEIARELGIQPGTVKIHLKHIFEKTGVRGRYGLALTGLRDRNAAEECRKVS